MFKTAASVKIDKNIKDDFVKIGKIYKYFSLYFKLCLLDYSRFSVKNLINPRPPQTPE